MYRSIWMETLRMHSLLARDAFFLNLLKDLTSRQLDKMLLDGASLSREEYLEQEKKSPAFPPLPYQDYPKIVDLIFQHPLLREKLHDSLENTLRQEMDQKVLILRESLEAEVLQSIEKEKPNIKSQLYNTLRYDLLQYFERKKVGPTEP